MSPEIIQPSLPDSVLNNLGLVPDDIFSTEDKILSYQGKKVSPEIARMFTRWIRPNLSQKTDELIDYYILKRNISYSVVGIMDVIDSVTVIILHEKSNVSTTNCYAYLMTVKDSQLIDLQLIAQAQSEEDSYLPGSPIVFERLDKNFFSAIGKPYLDDVIDEDGNSEEHQFKELFYIGKDGQIKNKKI